MEPEQEITSESVSIDDGFIRIEGDTFQMGSPEDENWRIDDETPHEVTVAAFHIDPYETTQAEWEAVMGSNPGTFTGENLPGKTSPGWTRFNTPTRRARRPG